MDVRVCKFSLSQVFWKCIFPEWRHITRKTKPKKLNFSFQRISCTIATCLTLFGSSFEIIKPNIYIYIYIKDLWKLFMAEIDNFNLDTSGPYRIWNKQLHRTIRQLEIILLQQYKAPVSEPAGICGIRFKQWRLNMQKSCHCCFQFQEGNYYWG